jgi:hypothetical protein
MIDILFKAIGALGILFVSAGVLKAEKKIGSIFYLLGGICLEFYSIYINDLVFIILQGIFIIIAAYKVWKVWK